MPTPEFTQSVWELDADEFPSTGDIEEQATFLLRYAILAPSSHNSQPWEFMVTGNEIAVDADESRWLEAADPQKRELYISVGCALENICVAAEKFGFDPQVAYHEPSDADYVATVTLLNDAELSNSRSSELFDAPTTRYTSHDPFEKRPLGDGVREKLRARVIEDHVSLHLVDNSETKTAISELQAEADRLLMEDPTYRKELGHWIGLGALGSSWLMARIGQAVVTHLDIGDREAAKNSKLIDSAPALGVLTAASDDSTAQVRTGQAFERVALLATTDGVAVHPMSQTLERPELRTRLSELLDTTSVPQHLFRLGYTDEAAEHTPRWPLETFLGEEWS
jgi:nitroreductase